MRDTLKLRGALLTAGYLLVIIVWVSLGTGADGKTRWEEFTSLSLNNIGDFLAGVFSPLALLWLVLGFFQQGEELRLQARELHAAVEQHRIMAKVALDEQAILREERETQERASAPRFVFRLMGVNGQRGNRQAWVFNLSNVGGECTDVRITVHPGCPLEIEPEYIHRLDRSQPHQLTFRGYFDKLGGPQLLTIRYFDQRGRLRFGEWHVVPVQQSGELVISFAGKSAQAPQQGSSPPSP